jgi:hypothetical protein
MYLICTSFKFYTKTFTFIDNETASLVLRRGIIAKYVPVRSHYGIILPQMGQTRDEALEKSTYEGPCKGLKGVSKS